MYGAPQLRECGLSSSSFRCDVILRPNQLGRVADWVQRAPLSLACLARAHGWIDQCLEPQPFCMSHALEPCVCGNSQLRCCACAAVYLQGVATCTRQLQNSNLSSASAMRAASADCRRSSHTEEARRMQAMSLSACILPFFTRQGVSTHRMTRT